MLLIGVGGGLSFPALMTLAMSDSLTEDAGLASGLVSTTAQVGGALGLAVLATISTARSQELLVAGASLDSALTGGHHLAFGISARSGPVQHCGCRDGNTRCADFTPAAVEKSVIRAASENPVGHF